MATTGMAEAVNMNLAWGAIEEGAGLGENRIYSLGLGHRCTSRCLQDTTNVKSGPEYLLSEKTLCAEDINGSHGIYIRRQDQPNVRGENVPFFDECMQSKAMQFHMCGDRYFLKGEGWKEFAREKMLDIGDTVRIFALRCQSCEKIRGCMIKAYKKVNALTFGVHAG